MKRFIHQLTINGAVIIVAVLLLVCFTLAGLSRVDAADTYPPVTFKTTKVESLETRIEALHEKLKITQSQEELWNNVVQVMRGNAETMSTLLVKIKSRKANATTPVDDMKSYAEIADAHAKSVKKFIPAFEALYNSLSDDQKKTIEEAGLKF